MGGFSYRFSELKSDKKKKLVRVSVGSLFADDVIDSIVGTPTNDSAPYSGNEE